MKEAKLSTRILEAEEAKKFVRDLEKQHSKAMKKLKVREKVHYRLQDVIHGLGRFTYDEIVNDMIVGRIVVAAGPNGEAKIVNSFHVTRKHLHKDLHTGGRIKVTQSEKHWHGVKS